MKINLTLITFWLSIAVYAQPGQLDFSFPYFNPLNPSDPTSGTLVDVREIVSQPDGKLLVLGNFMDLSTTIEYSLIRIDEDGNADPTFQLIPYNYLFEPYVIHDIYPLSNGKLFAVGGFDSFFGNTTYKRIGRLNVNGSVDNSFVIQDTMYETSSASEFVVGVQNDDKMLVYYPDYNVLKRYNYDGSIDLSFSISGIGISNITQLTILENGSILMFGSFTSGNGSATMQLLNPDGSVDNLFEAHEVIGVSELIVRNNKIYCFDNELTIDNYPIHGVCIFDNNGLLNNTFFDNTYNKNFDGPIYSFDVYPNGKILIGGDFSNYDNLSNNNLIRLNADGTLDNSFTSFDGAQNGTVPMNKMLCLSDSKAIIAGTNLYNNYPVNTLFRIGNYSSNLQVYTTPSLVGCSGTVSASQTSTADLTFVIEGVDSILSTLNYAYFDTICSGIYQMKSKNTATDQTIAFVPFVVPDESNYFPVSQSLDTLNFSDTITFAIENCVIDYSSVSSVSISSYYFTGQDSLYLEFTVVDANQTTFIPIYLSLNYFGYNLFQLQLYCLQKSISSSLVSDHVVNYDGQVIQILSINESTSDLFETYPNPTNNEVTLTFDSNEAQVFIYDTQGKLIQTKSIHSGEQVSLKEVETGVYFFEVITEKGSAVKRVVKH
jgi:uncharacterized delta-60 repeat protein